MHHCAKCGKPLYNIPDTLRFDNIECVECFDANKDATPRPAVKQVYNVAQKAYDGVYLPNFTPRGKRG